MLRRAWAFISGGGIAWGDRALRLGEEMGAKFQPSFGREYGPAGIQLMLACMEAC